MAKKVRRFRKKAVLKAISRYTRRKMNYIMSVVWENNTLYIDGQQQNSFQIGDVLSGNTSEFQTLGKQYAMVKLRSIYIEAVNDSFSSGYNFGICLGQANDSIVFDNIRTQPNVMLLSKQTKTKMYVPIIGEFTSTNSIQLFTNMKIAPFAQGNPSARFTVRITLYLTFKANL